ncbi:MAG TPA: inositol monophosphatase family protein [Micropepsaceae bacterium]|jgi:myo-inositol-1(or 4)-monophosphatase|nr:inositol monophosphatase family protein [Micropepsaceae bacterium]
MPYLSPALNVMIAAARKAARALIRDFGELENLQISRKGPADFVSNADSRTERVLIEELTRARPGYGFLVEESGIIEGRDKTHRFIIDPIDGTTNFLHGIPQFCMSIALEREGAIVSGLVFNPVTDEMYVAEKGHGAFLNDRRLRVAARQNLPDILVASGAPFLGKDGRDQFLTELDAVVASTAGMRRFGSAALDLAWVASGRFDAFWERNLKPWDIAAGLLLVREAGGVVSDLDGRDRMLENGHILATNEALHRQLMDLLHGKS